MAKFLLDSIQDSGHNPVTFHPLRNYNESEAGTRTHHNMIAGNQQITYWPTRKTWAVPVTWVTSADAVRVIDWWENGHQLRWTLSESSALSTYNVRMANEDRPLQGYHQLNRDFFQGVLMLETIDDSAANENAVFILDEDILGLLDQDNNPIG